MATIYTDIGADQLAAETSLADRVILGEKISGAIKHARARITLAGALTTGDIIKVVKLPEGSVVLPSLCHAATPGVTAAVTLDIGTSADVDAFSDGIVLGTAAEITGFNAGAGGLAANAKLPAPFTAETWVQATVMADAATAEGEFLDFFIAYASRQ